MHIQKIKILLAILLFVAVSIFLLADELQDLIDAGGDKIQLKFSLAGVNSDGVPDWYKFQKSAAVLHVKYEIPG